MSSTVPLFPREETGSNGCVVCSSVPDCPTCGKNERCVQSTQTCSECPKTYCKTVSSTSSSSSSDSASIGGVAGGVIGGVILLLVSGYLFYRFYLKQKLAFKKVHRGEFYQFDDDAEINFHHKIDIETTDELEKPSSRSSFATVFTRASNIIPIAYIPGVTIGTNRESTISNNTFDSELVGDRFSKASIVKNPSLTTTAIRAKPRLITVSNSNNEAVEGQDGIPQTAVGSRQFGNVKSIKIEKKKNFEPLIEENEDEEYDHFIIDDAESIKSNGSVLLEVEMDTHHDPFDDQYETT